MILRIVVATLALLIAASAQAQDSPTWRVQDAPTWRDTGPSTIPFITLRSPPCVDQFKNLPALAERLGVKSGESGGSVVLGMCDGRKYDFIDLMNALVDRMERDAR